VAQKFQKKLHKLFGSASCCRQSSLTTPSSSSWTFHCR